MEITDEFLLSLAPTGAKDFEGTALRAYAVLNSIFFDSTIPPPTFVLMDSTECYGSHNAILGKVYLSDALFNDGQLFLDVLLHEMLHEYVWQVGLHRAAKFGRAPFKDIVGHNTLWREKGLQVMKRAQEMGLSIRVANFYESLYGGFIGRVIRKKSKLFA